MVSSSSSVATLHETYLEALKLGYANPNQEDTLVCVAQIPVPWFDNVDEHMRVLAPPDNPSNPLFDDFYTAKMQNIDTGMGHDKAHNEAAKEVNFRKRYRQYLQGDEQQAAIDKIIKTLSTGTDVWLVCYVNTDNAFCHREVLQEVITEKLNRKVD
jgi:Protein of unknown function, DUF488.